MILEALEAKRYRKGRVAGSITGDTMGFYERKLGHSARILGIDTPLAQVDYDAIGRYIKTRMGEPGARRGETVKQHTVFKEIAILRFALKLQKRKGRYPHDVDYVTRVGEFSDAYEPEKRALTWKQIPRLLAALVTGTTQSVPWETLKRARELRDEGRPIAEVAELMQVAYATAHRYLDMPLAEPRAEAIEHAQMTAWIIATATRISEARRAEMQDHDLTTWRVFIRGKKSKRALGWIPIAPPFRRYLEFAIAGRPKTGPLFSPWGNVSRGLSLACERAGLAPVSPNDLRRTHTSLLSHAGVNNTTLKGVSRHSTTRMLDEIYTTDDIDAVAHLLSVVTEPKGD